MYGLYLRQIPQTIPLILSSREDTITAQPKISGRQEAAMAPIRQAVVRWMYNSDHWQFVEGRHKIRGF
jgi:hypothetical protein